MTSPIRTVDDVLALLREMRDAYMEKSATVDGDKWKTLWEERANVCSNIISEIQFRDIAEITRRRAGSDGEVGT